MTNAILREAREDELPKLVTMLISDPLGAQRESVDDASDRAYIDAFNAIAADPNNELLVLDVDGALAGMLQLTYIPNLTYQGSWRCLIEGVRIDSEFRNLGLGEQMFTLAVERAKQRNCALVQLTCDKQRPDAIRFYTKLGFNASHEGMKLKL